MCVLSTAVQGNRTHTDSHKEVNREWKEARESVSFAWDSTAARKQERHAVRIYQSRSGREAHETAGWAIAGGVQGVPPLLFPRKTHTHTHTHTHIHTHTSRMQENIDERERRGYREDGTTTKQVSDLTMDRAVEGESDQEGL